MSAILTSDLHMNERQRDQYRWDLFPWLEDQRADDLIIGGDLTDAKDRHTSVLVNRMHSAILDLSKYFRIVILKGNHDYIDQDHPFFEFLGDNPDVTFVTAPTELELSIGRVLFVPAGTIWPALVWSLNTDYMVAHATFNGAKSENGTLLPGVDPSVVKNFPGKVYSGDIHVPQVLNRKIEYIGAPYHTRFGDEFEPRLIHLNDGGEARNLYFPAPKKLTFTITEPKDLDDEKARKGDHVKVKCLLRRADYTYWKEYKDQIRVIAEERGWQLFGTEPVPLEIAPKSDEREKQQVMEPDELVAAYVKKQRASAAHLKIGRELLNG